MQNYLYKAVVDAIAAREAKGKITISLLELRHNFPGEDMQVLTEIMRSMVRSGRYKGGLTVNKIPIITLKEYELQSE